jgi:uncharacterized membrane protein YfcA
MPPSPPWIFLVVIGLIGGVFSGAFGVGGGLIMVPLLLWWTTFDQRKANATSLLAITPASLIGAISFSIGGIFEWFPALFVALGSVVGAQLGARMLTRIPLVPLRWAFISFIVFSSIGLFLEVPNRDGSLEVTTTTALILLGLGLLMGIGAGLLGIGGGLIATPAIMLFLGGSDLAAKSISLLAMAPGALSGSILHVRHKTALLRDGAWVAAGAVVAAPIGAYFAFALSPRVAAILFGVLTAFVAVSLTIRAIKDGRN